MTEMLRATRIGWLLAATTLSLLLSLASPARAEGPTCGEAASAWARRCAQAESIELAPSHCPPGAIVVRIGGVALTHVEIRRADARSFRVAGQFGLSPLGEYADWSKEPEARRRGLDALAACVSRDPPPFGAAARAQSSSARAMPWLAILALVALGIACSRHVRDFRRALRVALVFVAAAGAVMGLRWLILPGAFFHQNGHGAFWIATALSDQPKLSSYGPGYAELFGWAARMLRLEPERGVFLFQSLLGALAVPCAFVVARACGARRLVAAALALVVALDPLLARIAQSESYFATFVALGFLAAAALAQAGRKAGSIAFVAAVAAAGLFTAQAARVHPLGWAAFSLLPIVVVCGRGRLRTRLGAAAAACAGIATIVAAASGSAMLAVLRGALGAQWLPHAYTALRFELVLVGLAVATVIAIALRSKRGALFAASALVTLAVASVSNLAKLDSAAIAHAHQRAFWPVAIAIVAAVLGRVPAPRAVAAGVALIGVAFALAGFRAATELPTDAREARLAIEWRRSLPEHAVVAYVERADKHIFRLPLYDDFTAARPFPITLGDDTPPDLSQLGSATVYYYRSSVCSSVAALGRCERFERALELERVFERELPALPSLRGNTYTSDVVRVGLHRVR